MKQPRPRTTLVLSRAFHPPPPALPCVDEVISALRTPPAARTSDDIQFLLRYFVANRRLLRFIEDIDRVRQAVKTATFVTIRRDEILFFEGDEPDGWFMVVTGSVDVIIRLFLVAHDCLIDDAAAEALEFAQLMDRMDLDATVDQLKRVNRLKPGDIFGHHAYLLERRRAATIVGASDDVILARFDPAIFQQTSALMVAKSLFNEHVELIRQLFPTLSDLQVTNIAALAEVIELKAGRTITGEITSGRSLYVIKTGTIRRYRVVDFTELSYRKFDAPFESLQLHFPSELHPVHTDDLEPGALFADPAIEDLNDSKFVAKTATYVQLLALDADYFRIVVGRREMVKLRERLKSTLTEEAVIKIWVEAEKVRLWEKFKQNTTREAHREIKTDKEFKHQTLAIRVPKLPKALKPYKFKKVVPYAPKSLRR
jgi:CRP-like cAMP-binding protein